jgi:hypothetical protein
MGKKTYIDFIPEPDITAYELAVILKGVSIAFNVADWDKFSPEVKRHFKSKVSEMQ